MKVFNLRRWQRCVRAGVGSALTVAALTAGATAASAAPTASDAANLSRVVTDNSNYADGLAAIGDTPVCVTTSNGTPVDQNWSGPAAAALAKSQVIASGDLEAMAACNPTAILTWDFNDPTVKPSVGDAYQAIAPTYYAHSANGCTTYTNTPADDGNPTGACYTTWKELFFNMAQALGTPSELAARQVIVSQDLHSAALRGQVAGMTVAPVNLFSWESSFVVLSQTFPYVNGMLRDLDLNIVTLPADDYASSCNPLPSCTTNALSYENLPDLDSADLIVMQTETGTPAEISAATTNPLFASIPAVKAGRVAQGPWLSTIGPLTVSYVESLIEGALKISAYHATLTQIPTVPAKKHGKHRAAVPAKPTFTISASLTFAPATRKLCWAATPQIGNHPSGSAVLTLKAATRGKHPKPAVTVKLTSSVNYQTPEAVGTGWNTTPYTYLASGCAKLSATDGRLFTKGGANVTLTVTGHQGRLQAGTPSIIYSSTGA